jgi:hypothetical protein
MPAHDCIVAIAPSFATSSLFPQLLACCAGQGVRIHPYGLEHVAVRVRKSQPKSIVSRISALPPAEAAAADMAFTASRLSQDSASSIGNYL